MTRKPSVLSNMKTFDSTTYATDFYIFLDCYNIELRHTTTEFTNGFVSIDIDFETRLTAIKFKLFFQIMRELGGSITILNLFFLILISNFIYNDWLNAILKSVHGTNNTTDNK